MKKLRLPLFWKFTIAIITIVSIFGSINILMLKRTISLSLENESEKRGKFIAHYLANMVVNPMLYENYILIQRWLENVVEIDSSVMYAFVWDKKNNMIIHNFSGAFPKKLLHVNSLKEGQKENILMLEEISDKNIIIRDIAVPVISPEIGVVRVGIKEKNLKKAVNVATNQLMLMVVVFLFFGILGALFFSHVISHPIHIISEIAENIDLDSFRVQVQPRVQIRQKLLGKFPLLFRAYDELDILSEKFNAMLERLEKAYRELEHAYASLIQSEKLASLGTLSAGLAHEINNPIAGIQNCIRRIKNNPGRIEQNKVYLEMMEEAANRIETVVRSLLDYARPRDMDFQFTRIETIMEKSILLVAYKLEKYQITVTKEIQQGLPPIYASEHHLEQVLVNLILNAIDAIEEKCQKKRGCRRSVRIQIYQKKDTIVIIIEDTGIGIAEENLTRIFDPFYTTKKLGKGTGMGLPVCCNIIKAHNGTISVRSTPGKGTVFRIKLPIDMRKNSKEKSISLDLK
jgi:two-component system NtrC family sensor kinase